MSTGQSRRLLWLRHRCRGHGTFTEIIPSSQMHADSVVMASITEIAVKNGREVPHLGNATMQILNVTPEQGRVMVRARVDWGSPLQLRISLLWDPDTFAN